MARRCRFRWSLSRQQCGGQRTGSNKARATQVDPERAFAGRLQLHALVYNPGNSLPTLATLEPIKDLPLTTLNEKLVKIGAKVVNHARYFAFQMAAARSPAVSSSKTTGEVPPDNERFAQIPGAPPVPAACPSSCASLEPSAPRPALSKTPDWGNLHSNPGLTRQIR